MIAVPYQDEAIVLDMAMSQYSFGAMELAEMKHESFPVFAGYDLQGQLTNQPADILQSRRPLPVGYWKGAGLALLLDILATVLSGGWSTADISERAVEFGLSQVFIAIDIRKLANHSMIPGLIQRIIDDYQQSVSIDAKTRILYPGERVLTARKNNLENGVPVLVGVWEQILKL